MPRQLLKPQKPKPPAPTPALSGILDNRENGKVGEFLREKIAPGAEIRVVSAYFSIYAHQHLSAQLERAGAFRFLFGDPRSVGNVDPGETEVKRFLVSDEGGVAPAKALEQKYAAMRCEEWVKRLNVEICTMQDEGEFLHGKMFHILPENGEAAAVCGSSNFTARGLGFFHGNRELNLVADAETRKELRIWFDRVWKRRSLSRNAKGDVLDALHQLGKNQDPDFIYHLTLYRLFHEELEKAEQSADETGLEDSEVWRQLYPFQRDAVHGVIRRLKRWGGCILADSVGLGKTYTALAVIKHFWNERVLVLCPKRLEHNWTRFQFDAPGHNPLEADQFRHRVQAHTDLGRETGVPDWSKYDLVVIDESHNFRNAAGQRYKILLDAMRKGARTKVLMLSATPINTSLKDIRNQILLMAEDGRFHRELGIASVEETVRLSQQGFAQWEKAGGDDKDALMERLGGAFMKLVEAVSIARSRGHIQTHYADSFADKGGTLANFPKRAPPESRKPDTDKEGELSYARIHRDIERFGLSVYRPAFYLRPGSELHAKLEAEYGKTRFKQTHREKFLIGMMRINFLKRLESSAHSFCETLRRTIEKIRDTENKIARVRGGETGLLIGAAENAPAPDEYGEDDDLAGEDYLVGKALQYDLRQMRLDDWSRDLKEDRGELEKILALAKKVTPARDAKLAELREILRRKAKRPNPKALVFTAFSDTARHLYNELREFARKELKLRVGLVVGSGENRTTAEIGGRRLIREPDRSARYGDILDHFAPRARGLDAEKIGDAEIDILIATDCVSEGQNLQDCDMVVNYDIHWNPVRIIQRFGRVDRIGGRNPEVRRVDFWPNMKLDKYLKLQARVHARMALGHAVTPGEDWQILEKEAKRETDFRDEQLKRLREKALTGDELGGVSISDFTMADFLAELRAFLESRREELESAPDGLFAVVEPNAKIKAHPGIIFCLKRKSVGDDSGRENPAHPFFLVYVRRDGGAAKVHLGFPRAKKILRLFGELCRGKKADSLRELCAAFDGEIRNGERMDGVNAALSAAVDDIAKQLRERALRGISRDRAGKIPKKSDQPDGPADFELVSWLVIRD